MNELTMLLHAIRNEGAMLSCTDQWFIVSYNFKNIIMAIVTNEPLLAALSGKLGPFVVKQYKNRIVVCLKPDNQPLHSSPLQDHKRKRFGEAVKYAKGILRDPVKKAAYQEKVKEGEQVYHYAVREFLANEEER
jgi:hypothetical protein